MQNHDLNKELSGVRDLREKLKILEKESQKLRKEFLLRKKEREKSGPLADLKSGIRRLKKMIAASEAEMLETTELIARLEANFSQTEKALDEISRRFDALREASVRAAGTMSPAEEYAFNKALRDELMSMKNQLAEIKKKRASLEHKLNKIN